MRFYLQAMLKPGPLIPHDGDGLLVVELYERILGRDAGVRAARLRILHMTICAESRVDIGESHGC